MITNKSIIHEKISLILIFVVLLLGLLYINQNQTKLTNQTNHDSSQNDFKSHAIKDLELQFITPKDFIVTTEKLMNLTTNEPYGYSFYVQNYKDSPTDTDNYQLYGIYQFDTEKVGEEVFDNIEKDLLESKRTTIGGLPAISGFNKGARQRYVIYILKDGHLLTLTTAQATDVNIKITEEIIKTFVFD